MADFLSAYNAGAPDTVDRFVAPASRFQWFAQPDRPFPSDTGDAQNRATLQSYLLKRHRLGDHYELKSLTVARDIDAQGDRAFSIQMTLTGSVRTPTTYGGKGAITCDRGRLAVWLIYAGPPAR